MTVIRNILLLSIVVELAGSGYALIDRISRIAPPEIDSRRLDIATAKAFVAIRKNAVNGGLAGWRQLAEAYLGIGHYLEAEQCFRHASQLAPADIQAEYGMGFCLERMGQTTAAIKTFTHVAQRADKQLRNTCMYQIGRCFLREENPEEAEATFRLISDQPGAAYQLAKLLIRSNRADEATEFIDRQLAVLPNSLKFLQLKQRAAILRGDSELASELRDQEDRAEYKLVLEYGQSFISMFAVRYGLSRILSRAMQLRNNGSLRQRKFALDEALRIIRTDELWQYRSVYIAAANVELSLGNIDTVRTLIAEIKANTHDGIDLRDLEAMVAVADGDDESAYQIWQLAASMSPSAFLYQRLAETRHNIDEELRQTYRGQQLLYTGMDALRDNRLHESQALLEDSVRFLPGSDAAFFNIGEAYRIQGHVNKAKVAFEECLRINPHHWRAMAQLEKLIVE